MDERGAARFNPYHAKAGSSTGGQFSSSSGGSGGKTPAKAPGGHAAPPPGGSHDAAKTPKERLLAEAHADEKRARELETELHALQKQHHAAAAAAKHHAAQAAAAKKAGHAVHHHHHTAAHHRHHRHAQTLKQRISHLKTEIHGLREKAADLEKQAHASRSGDSGIPGHLPHQLASWWERGAGAAKIGWGTPGSFMRCVRLAEEEAHMTPERAKGFCAERYHAATGKWPGEHHQHAGRAAMADMSGDYDADGLDGSWDGDCSDLPDLSGLDVSHFEAAGGTTEPAAASRAMPKLGTGKRFAKLKGALAAKGAHDPGALAAYIGRKKFGKAKFTKLASAARKGGGMSRSEILRFYPLDDIHIVSRADGDGSGRVVEAYAAVFDEATEIKDHEGHYEETIDRGAFDERLAQIQRSRRGLASAVRVLYNHGQTMRGAEAPEFQKPLGKPLEVRPDGRGLLTRTEYGKSPLAEEILENIRAGSITAQSFVGGIMRSDPELRGPGDKHRARNGVLTRVRRLGLGLREYGPVLYAAYPGAEFLGVRMGSPELASDFSPPDDEECAPADEGAATGGAPEDATSARYHQHVLYAMRSRELREAKGLVI